MIYQSSLPGKMFLFRAAMVRILSIPASAACLNHNKNTNEFCDMYNKTPCM